jgi:hypothetical protein
MNERKLIGIGHGAAFARLEQCSDKTHELRHMHIPILATIITAHHAASESKKKRSHAWLRFSCLTGLARY